MPLREENCTFNEKRRSKDEKVSSLTKRMSLYTMTFTAGDGILGT